MSYGIKISKEGYDVKTASGENLIYSSEFNNWKIVQSSELTGEITLVIPASGASYYKDIVHNLGYPPACEMWVKGFGGKYYAVPSAFGGVTATIGVDIYIDSTKIRVYAWTPGAGETTRVKYKIYYENLAI
jgi:hypothetical protein